MSVRQTPYSVLLVTSGVLLLAFSLYVLWISRDRRSRGAVLASLLTVLAAEWVLAYTVSLSVGTLQASVFWLSVQFVGVGLLPLVWLAFVLWYTGHDRWYRPSVFAPLGAVTVGFLLAVATNEFHGLVFSEFSLLTVGSIVVLDPTYGPVFWAFLVYAATLLFLTLGLLAGTFLQTRRVFRWQIGALCVVALVAGVAGLLSVTGISPLTERTIATMATVVLVVGGAISLFRVNWMNITPVNRTVAFDAMSEAVVVVDSKHRVVDLNSAAVALLDARRAAIVGTPIEAYLPNIDSVLADSSQDGTREFTSRTDDGRQPFEVTVSAVEQGSGEDTGYTLLLRDATEPNQAEPQCQTYTERITELHRIATDIMAAETADDVFDRTVSGAASILPCDETRLALVDGGELIPVASSADEAAAERESQPLGTCIAGHSYRSDEPIVIDDLSDTRSAATATEKPPGSNVGAGVDSTSDRSEQILSEEQIDTPEYRSLLTIPIDGFGVLQVLAAEPNAFDDDDTDVATLLASHISTALTRVKTEQELRRERDRLDEFARVLSHDIRNPLNVAQGRLELIEEGGDVSDNLPAIERAHTRIQRLMDDLLTLAREGTTVGDTEHVRLDTVARNAWETVNSETAELQITADGTVVADRSRLQQVFENLYRNAIEHEGDDVRVTVGDMEDGFYVEDNGVGIPASERDRVFDSGYTTAQEGTGFGLTIVKQIVDAHEWRVECSEGDDGGARFEFCTAPNPT